jgi:hypothetical protein
MSRLDPSSAARATHVIWSKAPLKRLKLKLAELEGFIAENHQALANNDYDVPLDPSTQDFWEYHYEM